MPPGSTTPETAEQAAQMPSDPGASIASCDRCNTRIHGVRYKCQQCPDFDYCAECVAYATSIHPSHDFTPLRGSQALSEEEAEQHTQLIGTKRLDPTTFRLIGRDSPPPEALCASCQGQTQVLSRLRTISQDKALLQKDITIRWAVRISSLIEATVGGCAFCSLVLDRFFGDLSNTAFFTYEPSTPWVCQTDCTQRQDLVAHAMHLLTLMKSDAFLFGGTPIPKEGSAQGDFYRLRIELLEAKQDKDVLRQTFRSPGAQYLEVNVYAAEDDPAAAFISTRPPNASPASQKALDQVKSWLARCEQEHGEACAARCSRLPPRVIDISDINRLQLLEPLSDRLGRYVALSYCRGEPQTFQTTTDTINDRLSGFALSALPQTFQDAVTVTKALNIDYLWIDSICMLQDDHDDKERETSHMVDIFKDATLTISASKARSASEGFLQDGADPETGLWRNLLPLAFPIPNPAATSLEESSKMPVHIVGKIWLCNEDPGMVAAFRSPIDRQGWALQERMLSSRFVSYGRWPTWKCSRGAYSDGGFYPQTSQSGLDERQLSRCLSEHRQHLHGRKVSLHTADQVLRFWYKLVNEYTQRELSVQSDRLPGIGGIATEISRVTGIAYVAGLWETNLLHDLMWSAKGKEWLLRPKDYRGPTWSWASVECPVSYNGITEDSFEIANVLQCGTGDSPSGAFGEVLAGRLEIEGPFSQVEKGNIAALLREQEIAKAPPSNNDAQQWNREMMEFFANLPCRKEGKDWVDQMPDKVFAIITHSRDWRIVYEKRVEGVFYSGVLLFEVDGGYERLGVFLNEDREWLDQTATPWQRRRIVLL